MKYLIFGLGNIGTEYTHTRHNIGFMILDAFAEASNIVFEQKRYAYIAQKKIKGRQVILIKPTTYMNLSGKAVRYWMQKEKVPVENILVISDDVNLPTGKIRLRAKGSDGGHNGLKNIIELIGTQNFARLRYGIGNDFNKGQQVDYVLGEMTDEEKKIFSENLEKCLNIINAFVTIGIDRTMNLYNKK
jgi:PTH1 family peptidyl-tRNA hydrolase